MHENNPATGATVVRRLSLLLALGALGTAASATATEPAVSAQLAATPTAGAATARPAAPPAVAPAAASAAPKAAGPKRKAHLRACPSRMPEELNPPADATLELVLPASGVQSYACAIDKPGEAPDWQAKGPHATLGEGTNVVGIHSGGPSWQALDGSTVKGSKIASAPSPDKSAITWLLLSGTAKGQGTFGKITHIQRLETVGGRPPSGGCDASHLDTRVLVPYRSYYYFYRLSEPGEKVQQCRSAAEKRK